MHTLAHAAGAAHHMVTIDPRSGLPEGTMVQNPAGYAMWPGMTPGVVVQRPPADDVACGMQVQTQVPMSMQMMGQQHVATTPLGYPSQLAAPTDLGSHQLGMRPAMLPNHPALYAQMAAAGPHLAAARMPPQPPAQFDRRSYGGHGYEMCSVPGGLEMGGRAVEVPLRRGKWTHEEVTNTSPP